MLVITYKKFTLSIVFIVKEDSISFMNITGQVRCICPKKNQSEIFSTIISLSTYFERPPAPPPAPSPYLRALPLTVSTPALALSPLSCYWLSLNK